ncbi:hypothetical protein SLA2020_014260 [Shorea laevis]
MFAPRQNPEHLSLSVILQAYGALTGRITRRHWLIAGTNRAPSFFHSDHAEFKIGVYFVSDAPERAAAIAADEQEVTMKDYCDVKKYVD